MSDLSRRRRLGGHRSAGRAAALATAACLLVSCSGPAPEDVGGPDAGVSAGSAPPRPHLGATLGTSPSGRPEALASQLDRAVAPPPPGELLDDYRAAQRRTGVPWTYLAAINLVETRMGRIRGTSTAGARGPMQFIPVSYTHLTLPTN